MNIPEFEAKNSSFLGFLYSRMFELFDSCKSTDSEKKNPELNE